MLLKPSDPHLELTDGEVLLRAPVPKDAAAVAALVRASYKSMQPWLPWATKDYSEDTALEYWEKRVDPTSHPLLIFNINGTLVGAVGLDRFNRRDGVAELGYWIGVGHRGRGYATRATNLVLRHAIDTVGLERVEIICSVNNEPSRRVADRSIATYEGIRKKRLRVGDEQHDAHCFYVVSDGFLSCSL
jgi:RimJ/RimL family protein N-acetyltransferase